MDAQLKYGCMQMTGTGREWGWVQRPKAVIGCSVQPKKNAAKQHTSHLTQALEDVNSHLDTLLTQGANMPQELI